MSLSAALLPDNALFLDARGAGLHLGLNWYRSLPLSCLETLEVTIGGDAIPRSALLFELHGSTRALEELRDAWDEEWFILDLATLRFRSPPELALDEELEVTVVMGNRIPYILIGPDRTLEYISRRTRVLKVLKVGTPSLETRP